MIGATAIRVMLLLAVVALPSLARAQPAGTDVAAFARAQSLLDAAKVEATAGCTAQSDLLVRVLCAGEMRAGLRTFYPGFSVRDEKGVFSGFEVDVAARIATYLGVRLTTKPVDGRNRIPQVADGQVDLVIATMGHNLQRDGQVRFIRPHYYRSQTVLVGPKDSKVADWDDLVGRTACVPLGSSSNITIIQHHIRVMTFDKPEQLLDALGFNLCGFIVHDDTFFGTLLTDPDWSRQFAVKFGFAPLPWGMAVPREGAGRFADLLTQLSIAFHAGGVFLEIARADHLDTGFLSAERTRWSDPACIGQDGAPVERCMAPPVDTSNAADSVGFGPDLAQWLERHATAWFGVALDLTLLKSQSAFELLVEGIGFSLALIAGSLLATTLFALAFGRMMESGLPPLRWLAGTVTAIGQTTPMPLMMFFAYVIAAGLVQYTASVALVVAIVVLGFFNGCYAGRAIHEALQALRLRDQARGITPGAGSFRRGVSVAAIQLVAFLINAAKGSPAAGMIGVPEFLNVITDLTSYSSDRIFAYVILLAFYTGLVLVVIALLAVLQSRLQASVAANVPAETAT